MTKVLVIYTGGTIGMVNDPKIGALIPFTLDNLQSNFKPSQDLNIHVQFSSLSEVKDSSNIEPNDWLLIAEKITNSYQEYDGFVVLHGTDTISYSASALSFLFENLSKPIVFTGSQLPIGVKNSDANNNLEWAIKIAGNSKIPEVCVFFHQHLYRANRIVKISSEKFDAFASFNYPFLASVQNSLSLEHHSNSVVNSLPFNCLKYIESNVLLIKIYPGIQLNFLQYLKPKGIVLETFGSGNIPLNSSLINSLKNVIANNCYVLNVTQCLQGEVNMNAYETGKVLLELGVISGKDITTEAALSKMMVVLGNNSDDFTIRKLLSTSIRGEMSN